MSEVGKTSVYVGAALVLAVVAYVARPRVEPPPQQQEVGKPLFPPFQEVDKVKLQGLEIVRYDEELDETYRFEVARNAKTGLWTIPSHSNYPADAEDRIRDAATIFVGLEVLGLASGDPTEHALFGVLEPSDDQSQVGEEGVGLLVSFEADKGTDYSLLVGKKVKGADDQRFVRIPGQNPVYVVKVDPEKLSTKFEDWIEDDLLKLSTYDVENLRIKDYSLVEAVQGTFLAPRFDLATTWNSSDSKWDLDEFLTYQGRETIPTTLLDTEELNKEKLDELKNALDDLKIVDVRRKPKGLGVNLSVGSEFMEDRESRDSLRSRGFYPNQAAGNQYDLLAANGEVHVGMKDGLEYVLRFGNVVPGDTASEDGGLNRYLMVTARLDESKLTVPEPPEGLDAAKAAEVQAEAEKPEEEPAAKDDAPATTDAPAPDGSSANEPATGLVPVALLGESPDPPAAEGAEKPSPKAKPEPTAESTPKPKDPPPAKPDEPPAAEAKPAAEKPATEKPSPAKPEAEKPAAEKPVMEKPAEAKPTEAKPAEAKPAEAKPEEAKPAEAKPAAKDAPDETPQPTAEELQEERERLAKDYRRELDEWQEKKKKADNKVRELNARFADWYYVISDDVYKKIHLGRGDLIKLSDEAKEEGFGVDAFRNLQEKGVESSGEGDVSTE